MVIRNSEAAVVNWIAAIARMAFAVGACLITTAMATAGEVDRQIPSTISEQAQAVLRQMPDPAARPPSPLPDDVEGWTAVQQQFEELGQARQAAVIERLQPRVQETELGGVRVLDIRPRDWQDNGKVLVYTHGGAYVIYSAASTLGSSAVMAELTGLRVISVDYTLAPHAQWETILDEVTTVFRALLEQGYAMPDIALYGDSAGGSLAAGAVLKMRAEEIGMPAAVVLWSPWSDITETGDTYTTLWDAELAYQYEHSLATAADAYADPADQKHPYVSPVYGDYEPGFPPTLIQGGTREIFLSNFVRHYQAIDTAGQTVKLDLYEGMPHVFQLLIYGSPESTIALTKSAEFLREHLHNKTNGAR